MIELRITNGPLGNCERIFRVCLSPEDLSEFIAFLDEIPDRNGYNVHLLEYDGKEKQIRQGDINEIRQAIADPCYLERRKIKRAKKLILDLLELRGVMKFDDLKSELAPLSDETIFTAIYELRKYLEEEISEAGDRIVRHKFAEAGA